MNKYQLQRFNQFKMLDVKFFFRVEYNVSKGWFSEFIVTYVTNEANKIVAENNNILSTIEDKKIFIEAILNPPLANDKLKNAQKNHSKFIEDNGCRRNYKNLFTFCTNKYSF